MVDRPTRSSIAATLRLADTNGRHLGGYVTYSGIRTITVTGGHLLLNGRLLNLRGVTLHEQNISTGARAVAGADPRS